MRIIQLAVVIAAISVHSPVIASQGYDLKVMTASDSSHIREIKSRKVCEQLYQVRIQHFSKSLTATEAKRVHNVKVAGDSIQVEILLKQLLNPNIESILSSSGGRIEVYHQQLVQMIVPFSSFDWFEDCDEIVTVSIPRKAVAQETVSEGLDTLGAYNFHTKGYKGKGVDIAVVDIGFVGYKTLLGSELPNYVFTKSYTGNIENDTRHGTACAEIIHDIAPEASMSLINFETYTELLSLLDWLTYQSYDIVSFSVGFFNVGWPDGNSSISKKIDQLKSNGIVWISAVGNHAEKHWRGVFHDSDGDKYHNFSPHDEGNSIYLQAGEQVTITLIWDAWPLTYQDFDLELYRSTSGQYVTGSYRFQTYYSEPWEDFTYYVTETGSYEIVIQKYSATINPILHLYINTAYGTEKIEYVTGVSSILVPADSKGSISVGAVSWKTPGLIEDYSSQGPTEDGRTKPDLVAPTCVSVYSASYSPFCGTSASCPHVAGAAALYLSRYPSATPTEIANTFRSWSIDLGSYGVDNVYGSGLLHMTLTNSPPVLINPGDKSVYEGNFLGFYLAAVDDDGDDLVFSSWSTPSAKGATLNSNTGYFSWSPDYSQAGIYNVTFSITDGQNSDQEGIKVSVLNVNRPPVFNDLANVEIEENKMLSFTVSATDPDNEDTVTLKAISLPPGATFHSQSGSFIWMPSFDQAGIYDFILTATDGEVTVTDTVKITVINVNRWPLITDMPDFEAYENELIAFTVAATDPDVEDTISYTALVLPPGANFDPGTGSFVWVPSFEQAGAYDFVFTASDGKATTTDTVKITVLNVNRLPSVFSLLFPADHDSLDTKSTVLKWEQSIDPDTDDSVVYTIYLSTGDTTDWELEVPNVTDTFYSIGQLSESEFYSWKVVATDSCGGEANSNSTFHFYVMDMTPPTFEISILQNPILQNELDIYIMPSEPIISLPIVHLFSPNQNDTTQCSLLTDHYNLLYVVDMQLDSDGAYKIEACGEDLASNIGCSDLSFTSKVIQPDQEQLVIHSSGEVILQTPRGCVSREHRILITVEGSGNSSLGEFDKWKQVTILPTAVKFSKPAKLTIQVPGVDLNAFGIYHKTKDNLVYLPTKVVDDRHALSCEISELGDFVILPKAGDRDNQVSECSIPKIARLHQNFPNPFNQSTMISFYLDDDSFVELSVYNLLGQQIVELQKSFMVRGIHTIMWDGKDPNSYEVASGVYLYQLKVGNYLETKKMLLLK